MDGPAVLPAALAALTQAAPRQGSNSGSNPVRPWTHRANVSRTPRQGDWAFCLFTVARDGTWTIERTIYAPDRTEAQKYFHPLRPNQGVASQLSLKTSGRLPVQPHSELGDELGSGKNPVKIGQHLVHRHGRRPDAERALRPSRDAVRHAEQKRKRLMTARPKDMAAKAARRSA